MTGRIIRCMFASGSSANGTQPISGTLGANAPAPYSSIAPSQNDGIVTPAIERMRTA